MDVEITPATASTGEDELRSLHAWLLREPGVYRVTLSPARAAPGEMGGLSDTLQVALGAGGAGTVLAGSIATWLSTQRKHVTLRLRDAQSGREIEVDADVRDPDALVDEFLSAITTER
ncbi:effector-associated constant component EACC1 [Baekduia sp. Peel2402]|uniref:effector-associated constant component EACC1 n=1 Tax=Baekduia sp. Peel2402 TaxID=3458296 RepID=UPI00403E7451